jgi:hypothetical protein
MKSLHLNALAAAAVFLISACSAQALFINFDTDAYGNAITAPGLFDLTSPLTELYAPLGVHFSGPIGGSGGAILNQSGNFGVPALSGENFLAFNRQSDVAYSVDPETITFDTPMTSVSIFAAGGTQSDIFTMQAFGAGGLLLDNASVTTQGYAQLSVSSLAGIQWVVLSESGAPYFVYDDLSATPVPEPAAVGWLVAGAVVMVCHFRRRKFAWR